MQGVKSWCIFGCKSLCGFRPTGRLHLGHYFAVIRPGLAGATVLVANYHAPEVKDLAASTAALARFGVKNVVLQKDVFDARLYFELLALAKDGDLRRMTQYKSAADGGRTGQLLTYPVLMAHDVADYGEVLVGPDQAQHLEYARKLLRKHNAVHGTGLVVPTASVTSASVRDLRDPTRKMSKSSPGGCLFLDDSPAVIRLKVRKAVTTPEGRDNLATLYRELGGGDAPEDNAGLKAALADLLVGLLG